MSEPLKYNSPHSVTTGFFVDWDGYTRRFESPGEGMTCEYEDRGYPAINVIDSSGFVMYEASYYPTIEAVEAVGVIVRLISNDKITSE